MKQGASVAVDACDLVHASFPVTADVGNQVVVILLIHCACCSDDVRIVFTTPTGRVKRRYGDPSQASFGSWFLAGYRRNMKVTGKEYLNSKEELVFLSFKCE